MFELALIADPGSKLSENPFELNEPNPVYAVAEFVRLLESKVPVPLGVSNNKLFVAAPRFLIHTSPPFVDRSIPLVIVCVEPLPV